MSEAVELQTQSHPNPIWIRGLYMLLFLAIIGLVKGVVFIVTLLQFVLTLVNHSANAQLQDFGQGLSTYSYQITQFLVFNSEQKPFPFAPWRNAPPADMNDPSAEFNDGQ